MGTFIQPRRFWFSTTTAEVASTLTFEIDPIEQSIIDLIRALKAHRGAK